MIAPGLDRDLMTTRRRTRWAMAASVVVHGLFLLWLIFLPSRWEEGEVITEITFLTGDELELIAAVSASVPVGEESVSGSPGEPLPGPDTPGLGTRPEEERFTRAEVASDVVVRPQSDTAFVDRLEARLAALERRTPAPVGASMAAAIELPGLWGARAGRPDGRAGAEASSPVVLRREGGGEGGQPVALARGTGRTATRPALVAPPPEATIARPAEPPGGNATGSMRTLAGASLLGPIADRPILSYAAAVYPEWAKREGIEASATLYFVVRSDGTIKENIVIEKTAGNEDFDESARAALRVWKFEPLAAGHTGEQWGRITFHFRLADAR